MARIITYLDKETIKNLEKLAEKSGDSLSKTTSDLIEIGYKVRSYQDNQESNEMVQRKESLEEKHTEYLLKIMAVVNDIYRCVRNDKSKYSEENIADVLDKINSNINNFIKGG